MPKNLDSGTGVPVWLRMLRFAPMIAELISDIILEVRAGSHESDSKSGLVQIPLPLDDDTTNISIKESS